MVDYNPSIPQGTDNLSNSQVQMLNNFTELNTIFDADHYTWNNITSANRGLHRQVTLPAVLGADPTPAGAASSIYSKTFSAATTLFFANSAGNGALWYGGTGPGKVTSTTAGNDSVGTMTLGNGIIFKWGVFNVSTASTPYLFVTPFPTACFQVLVSSGSAAGTIDISVVDGTIAAAGFSARVNSGTHPCHFIAIGN